jgi:hypothetical protein
MAPAVRQPLRTEVRSIAARMGIFVPAYRMRVTVVTRSEQALWMARPQPRGRNVKNTPVIHGGHQPCPDHCTN